MSKDLYMRAHERLVEEYLEMHPEADWTEAYERTADAAHQRMRDDFAAQVDAMQDALKEGK